jgi:hypothetical protein
MGVGIAGIEEVDIGNESCTFVMTVEVANNWPNAIDRVPRCTCT